MARIGILGGSFDPIHLGHVRLAEAARDRLALDRVLLVPAAQQPLKRERRLAPAEDRLAMVRLAVAGRPRLEASDMEVARGGVSYTVDTARALRDALGPDAELVLILGSDALDELPRWRGLMELAGLVRIAVGTRPGHLFHLWVTAEVPLRFEKLDFDALPISATDVRRRLAAGEPTLGLLDPAVADYIRKKGLYA